MILGIHQKYFGLSRTHVFAFGCCVLLAGCRPGIEPVGSGVRAYASAEEALALEIALTEAAWGLDIDQVRELLRQGADPDGLGGTKARRYRYANGGYGPRVAGVKPTPLLACLDWYAPNGEDRLSVKEHGYDAVWERKRLKADVAHLLLVAGADPNFQVHDGYGEFALLSASEDHNMFAIQLLLDAGAEVTMSDELSDQFDPVSSPSNALGYAVRYEDAYLVKKLLEAEAFPLEGGHVTNPLERAAEIGRPEVLRLLLGELKPSRRYQAEISSAMTRLLRSWWWLADDEDLDDDDLAQVRHYKACFEMLDEAGATVEFGEDGSLYYIGQLSEPIVDQWFVVALAEHPARTQVTMEFLADVVLFDDVAAVERLTQLKLNLNVRDADGRTVLHYAAMDENGRRMAYLVHAGADVMVRDNEGKTALDLFLGDFAREEYEATLKELRGE